MGLDSIPVASMTDRPTGDGAMTKTPLLGEPEHPGEHEPHRGAHTDYACGFSGPHCWECGEPWPCRASRGIAPEPPQSQEVT